MEQFVQRIALLKRLPVRWATLAVLLGLLGGAWSAYAQNSSENLHEFHHTSYTVKDGLYGEVTALAQTKDGFLWVGTSEGLYRFDGVIFESYVPANGSLPDSTVTALLAVPDGSLWVGFAHGAVAHVRRGAMDVYTEQAGYPYGATRSLVRTADGAIWAAVIGSFARFDGSRWHKVRSDWSYPSRSAWGLFVDRQGTLWVGTSDRLMYLPANSRVFRDFGRSGQLIVGFLQTPDGTLWLSDGNTDTVQSFCSPLELRGCSQAGMKIHIGAWSLLAPKIGGLWFATETKGVRRIADVSLIAKSKGQAAETIAESFDDHDGLSGRYCWILLEDDQGDVWVGTEGGLDRFRFSRIRWTDVGASQLGVLPGGDAKPWIATAMLQVPHQIDAEIPDKIRPLLKAVSAGALDRRGVLWLGGADGIHTWVSGKISEVSRPDPLRGGTIYSIAGDDAGGAWMSIGGHGEFHYKHGAWEFVSVPGAEPDIAAVGTYVDDANRTWLLYDARKQVSVLENGSARSFTEQDGLAVGYPHVIAGQKSSLFVGGTQGLAYFEGNRFHTLYGGNGESFSDVFGIETSPSGELWLSTVRGLVYIAANDLENCMRAACSHVPYELIDLNGDLPQPLQGTPAGSFHLPTSLRDENGHLWFVTTSGVAVFDPKDLVQPDRPPPVIIRSAKLDGNRYFGTVSMSLPGRVHEMQIAYTAPNVSRPEDLRYRYRLTNWDSDWQYAGVRQEAIYSNIGPGRYIFQVESCNTQGICNSSGDALTLDVTPPFYQTLWFVSLLLGLGSFGLWIAYRLRTQQIIRRSSELMQERLYERERIARDLHDTLLQGVQALMFKFYVATSKLRSDEPMRPVFEATLAQSDQVLLEGRNLISSLHSEGRPANVLLESLQQIAEELRSLYPSVFIGESVGAERVLNAAARDEVCSLGREALTNAFRHGHASHIWLSLRYMQDELQLEVRDDGAGIPQEILEKGFRSGHWGLRNMKARARRLGAGFDIRSSGDSGTTIRVTVPALLAYANVSRSVWSLFRSLWK